MRAADWPAAWLHPDSSELVTEVLNDGIKKWTNTKVEIPKVEAHELRDAPYFNCLCGYFEILLV